MKIIYRQGFDYEVEHYITDAPDNVIEECGFKILVRNIQDSNLDLFEFKDEIMEAIESAEKTKSIVLKSKTPKETTGQGVGVSSFTPWGSDPESYIESLDIRIKRLKKLLKKL